MDKNCTATVRGRGRGKKNTTACIKSNFRWSDDVKLDMANYISENYREFKQGQRALFLRKMHNALHNLKILEEKQLRNGFERFLKCYTDIKALLQQSGFGVDMEQDNSLDKGWIIRKCPYFDILDAVMGTRPNLKPPHVEMSNSFGQIGYSVPQASNFVSIDASQVQNDLEFEEVEVANLTDTSKDVMDKFDSENFPEIDNSDQDADEVIEIHTNSLPVENATSSTAATDKVQDEDEDKKDAVSKYVKNAFAGLGVKRHAVAPKTAMGIFVDIMQSKIAEAKEVEVNKLNLESQKFEYSKQLDEKRMKRDAKRGRENESLARQKFEFEKEMRLLEFKFQEKKQEFELTKITKSGEIELKKLELQIELEKTKRL